MDHGSTYRRCGCRDETTGRLLGARCPGLSSPEHGSWYFSSDLPSAAGQRRRVRRGGFATQAAAAGALEALGSPAAGPEPGLSTGEWLGRWLASRVSLRASTARSYAAHIRGYLVPYPGGIPLAALSAGDVQDMFTAIIRDEAALGRPAGAATSAAAARRPSARRSRQPGNGPATSRPTGATPVPDRDLTHRRAVQRLHDRPVPVLDLPPRPLLARFPR